MSNNRKSIKFLNRILDDTLELIGLTRKGVEFQLFNTIMLIGPFSMREWSSFLHISERTLQRYKQEKKVFEPMQSERILEIAKIQKRGTEIFSSKENFEQWMNAKSIALGGVKPKEFLDSSFGIQILDNELTRIEYGILA